MRQKIMSLIFVALLAGGLLFYLTIDKPDIKSLLISVAASAIVVVFIEALQIILEHCNMSYLKGRFERILITNAMDVRDANGIYETNINQKYEKENVKKEINLRHLGGGRYIGSAFYEGGEVKFDICLNQQNRYIGTGIYQYLDKDDVGKYELQVNMTDKTKVYIYYENILPNGLARGYEIWQKC